MTLEDVLSWIKTLSVKADNYYCGTLSKKKENSFGVYQLNERRSRDMAISKKTETLSKGISILVHWNTSTRATESKALELYNALASANHPLIGTKTVDYIALSHNEPIDVGCDENGICERVIEFTIYYERI